MLLFPIPVAFLLLAAYGGFAVRSQLGNIKDRSFENYLDAIRGKDEVGVLTEFGAGVVYPFWRLAYALFGQPEANQKVEEKETPTPALDFEDILRTLNFELHTLLKDLPEDIIEAMVEDARDLLTKNLTPSNLDDPATLSTAKRATYDKIQAVKKQAEKEYEQGALDELAGHTAKLFASQFADRLAHARRYSPLVPLREAFVALGSSLKLTSKGSAWSLTASVPDLITPDALHDFYYKLVRHDIFGLTYGLFVEKWNRLRERMKITEDDDDKLPQNYAKSLMLHLPALQWTRAPIHIPEAARFEGTWIIGPQGSGKTTLLSVLLQSDLDKVRDGEATLIILDSKGELADNVRDYEEFAPGGRLAGKLTLIEPSSDLSVNLLDLGQTAGHSIALLEYVFSALLAGDADSKPSDKQLLLLRKLLLACRVIPGASLMTVREILMTGWTQYESYILSADTLTAEYFSSGQFDDKDAPVTKRALLWRIEDLLTRTEALAGMFRATQTKIDMTRLMDSPGVVIINNSTKKLTEGGGAFFGRFIVALILAAAQQRAGRADNRKLPVYVYMDEAQTVIKQDENVATIIETCRSQKIAMIFAHQKLSQIENVRVRDTLADCAIRIACPDKDAKALADDFRMDAKEMQSISHTKGRFALYIRGHTHKSLNVSVPNTPAKEWPKMSGADLAAIQQEMKERYSFTPTAAPITAPEPTPEPARPPVQAPESAQASVPVPVPVQSEDSTPKKWQRKKK